MQKNISKLRDPFIHTNCIAYLSNMTPHCTRLHPYAGNAILLFVFIMIAERMVSLLEILYRSYQKLLKLAKSSENGACESERMDQDTPQELFTIAEFIQVLLESIYICIQPLAAAYVFIFFV